MEGIYTHIYLSHDVPEIRRFHTQADVNCTALHAIV